MLSQPRCVQHPALSLISPWYENVESFCAHRGAGALVRVMSLPLGSAIGYSSYFIHQFLRLTEESGKYIFMLQGLALLLSTRSRVWPCFSSTSPGPSSFLSLLSRPRCGNAQVGCSDRHLQRLPVRSLRLGLAGPEGIVLPRRRFGCKCSIRRRALENS
jgi:hypothetical protein